MSLETQKFYTMNFKIRVLSDGDDFLSDFKVFGYWYLPNSTEKIPGLFSYEEGQSHLELFAKIDVGNKHNLLQEIYKEIPILYGDTLNGPATLLNININLLSNLSPPVSCQIHTCIFGSKLDEKSTVKKITFGFKNLYEWLFITNPQKFDLNELSDQNREIYDCDITSDIKLKLMVSIDTKLTQYTYNSHTHSNFVIESDSGINFEEMIIDYIISINYFLMIVAGQFIPISHIINSDNLDSTDNKQIFIPVKQIKINSSFKNSMIFDFFAIRNIYKTVFNNWFMFYKLHKNLIIDYCTTFEKIHIEINDFITYARFLDGYCKINLSKNIPSKNTDHYKSNIYCGLDFLKKFVSNYDEFITLIARYRHDLFHYNNFGKRNDQDIINLTWDLFFIMRLLIISNLDIDDKIIQKFITKIKFRVLKLK